MNSVVHFEIPAKDQKQLGAFYEKVFGWKVQDMGEEMGNYVVVSTTEGDPKTGRPKNPGAINGGIYKKSRDNQKPSFVIAVDDVDEHVEKIKAAGGKVITEPSDIPGVGRFASFVDPDGNELSIMKPMEM